MASATPDAAPSEATTSVVGRKRPRVSLTITDSMQNEHTSAPNPTVLITENAWWRTLASTAANTETLGVLHSLPQNMAPTRAGQLAEGQEFSQVIQQGDTPRTRYNCVFGRSINTSLVSSGSHSPSGNKTEVLGDAKPSNAKRQRADEGLQPTGPDGHMLITSSDTFGLARSLSRHPTVSNPFSAKNAPAYRYSVVHSRGQRKHHEDRFTVVANLLGQRRNTLYGVFDGHGGHDAAEFAAQHLGEFIERHWDDENPRDSIVRAFREADTTFLAGVRPSTTKLPPVSHGDALPIAEAYSALNDPQPSSQQSPPVHKRRNPFAASSAEKLDLHAISSSRTTTPASLAQATAASREEYDGCTIVALIVLGARVFVAHAGDSRAILVHADGSLRQLTADHTASVEAERTRVHAAGGHIDSDGRVCGLLDTTRGLGDSRLKQAGVIVDPEVDHFVLQPRDSIVVLATDGLWKSLENETVASIVSASYAGSLNHASKALPDSKPPSHGETTQTIQTTVDIAAGDPVASVVVTPNSAVGTIEPRTIAERLIAEAQLRGASDNVTVLVIDLTKPLRNVTSFPPST